jgi:MFS family permease
VLWLGLNFQSSALLPIVVPAQLLLLVDRGSIGSSRQALALSALSVGAAAIAVVVTPLAGDVSDRVRRRTGTRRRLILLGIGLAVIGQAGLGATTPVLLFLGGFVLMQIGTNAATAAYQGLLPDAVPSTQRGAASGWLGFMTLIGSACSLALAGEVLGNVSPGPRFADDIERGSLLFYAIAAVAMMATAAVTIVGIDQRRPGSGYDSGTRWTEALRHRRFLVVVAARAFVMIGLTLFLTYIEYYLAQVNGETRFVGATVAIALLALGGAVASSLTVGIASDRVSRVRVVMAANLLMAIAAVAFVVVPAGVPLAPLGILFGLGYGAYLSVDWALAVDSLPGASTSARDLGIFTVSINLPTLIAPLLGGAVILAADAAGVPSLAYRLVFGLAAVSLVLGIAVVRRIPATS